MEWIELLFCVLAGLGSGLGIGFASMSSAAVIGPVLITFLHVEPYQAIGIGLTCDVLAGAVSAAAYARHKLVDFRRSLKLAVIILLFTVLGSLLARALPDRVMGQSSITTTLVMAIVFLLPRKQKAEKADISPERAKGKRTTAAVLGALIGLCCGAFGAGGGMMILLVLTGLLGYEFKTAVGTSLALMAVISLFGAGSHMAFGPIPRIGLLIACVVSTALFARISASVAARLDSALCRRITGIILLTLAVVVIVFQRIVS